MLGYANDFRSLQDRATGSHPGEEYEVKLLRISRRAACPVDGIFRDRCSGQVKKGGVFAAGFDLDDQE